LQLNAKGVRGENARLRKESRSTEKKKGIPPKKKGEEEGRKKRTRIRTKTFQQKKGRENVRLK